MLGRLLLLFILVPVVELYLLIAIGEIIGPVATIALVLVTAFLGAALARREGARVLRSWQEATQLGQVPKEGVVSSVLIFLGGVLLVVPGVITDALGLLLLLPPVRRIVAERLKRSLERRFQLQAVGGPGFIVDLGGAGFARDTPENVIDVQAVENEPSASPDAR